MPLRKRPTTDQLYWRFQFQGRTHEKSMETSNRREAMERGMAWEVSVKSELARPDLYPTLAVLRDLDLERARKAKNSASYIKDGIGNYWARLIEFFPDVRSVNKKNVEAYREKRERAGIRGQTISKELVTLRRGLRLAHIKIDDVEFWPKIRSSDPSTKQAVKRHSLEVWQRWLAELEGPAYHVALFSVLTGLRWAELYRVQPAHIQEVEGGFLALTVQEKVKRARKRQVVLSPLALLLVDLGCIPFPDLDHKGARRFASKRAGAAGHVTLRDCRAAFASAAGSAVSAKYVDLLMGHSGVPARYFLGDYTEMARAAMAVQRWITGTAEGTDVNRQRVDKWTTL